MEPLRELSRLILRHTGSGPLTTWQSEPLAMRFISATYVCEPSHQVYEPVFALVVSGEKQLALGDQAFTAGKGSFLVVSVELPFTFQISRATPAEPYIALALKIDPAQVATLLLEAADTDRSPFEATGVGMSDATPELLEAVVRLVRLLDHPRDLAVLGSVVKKEILWRLLCSEQGPRLRQIGLADSRLSQIGRAMRWMREHYSEALRIEELARLSGMSVTSFHRHFRAVSLMSPLQYQKQIRLQEARTRLLAGADDVTTVGQDVGYDSASQFSREYKRAFGFPPGQDARLLRASNGAGAASAKAQRTTRKRAS